MLGFKVSYLVSLAVLWALSGCSEKMDKRGHEEKTKPGSEEQASGDQGKDESGLPSGDQQDSGDQMPGKTGDQGGEDKPEGDGQDNSGSSEKPDSTKKPTIPTQPGEPQPMPPEDDTSNKPDEDNGGSGDMPKFPNSGSDEKREKCIEEVQTQAPDESPQKQLQLFKDCMDKQ